MSISVLFSPTSLYAGVISDFTEKVKTMFIGENDATNTEDEATPQTMTLIKPVVLDADVLTKEYDDNLDKDALKVVSGSLRVSSEDIDFPTSDTISVYEVKKGDTLATVAKLFNVSKNTIIWANDLKSQALIPGDTLVILPMTGIKHTVKKGDTVASIAKKYKADIDDISKFNGVTKDSELSVGDVILVPEGELAVTTTTKTKNGKVVIKSRILNSYSYAAPSGFFIRPIVGGRKSQGLHGHNGIDLANAPGTPVMASAEGRVIVAKMGGYNGGYGNMIIMTHEGGLQTVYAHLRAIYVSPGQTVSQGTVIGELGNSGRSTGPHLHFEIRGAKNPF
jgi:murein DD-endopeptidase MepM/ murein hydrolase activator NlpD